MTICTSPVDDVSFVSVLGMRPMFESLKSMSETGVVNLGYRNRSLDVSFGTVMGFEYASDMDE